MKPYEPAKLKTGDRVRREQFYYHDPETPGAKVGFGHTVVSYGRVLDSVWDGQGHEWAWWAKLRLDDGSEVTERESRLRRLDIIEALASAHEETSTVTMNDGQRRIDAKGARILETKLVEVEVLREELAKSVALLRGQIKQLLKRMQTGKKLKPKQRDYVALLAGRLGTTYVEIARRIRFGTMPIDEILSMLMDAEAERAEAGIRDGTIKIGEIK